MKDLRIDRYCPGDTDDWNDFVASSRNATFLFNRGFMDYHGARFEDHSLIARDGGKIIALLPANLTADPDGRRVLHSHSGLTYGGWACGPRHPEASEMIRIFEKLKEYALSEEISALDYKPVPFIYSTEPSQEDLYALFRFGAKLTERNISAAINLRANPGFNTQQRRNLRRGEKTQAYISETEEVEQFHRLLSQCLSERYGASPVHTADELRLLKSRFPAQIRFFMVFEDDEAQAGVCLFDCGTVVHTQYICSTPRGRSEGLLTRLFHYLIDAELFPAATYFDFGTSNDDHGLVLNEGLYRQKSSLGGSGVAYDRYQLIF